MARTAAQRYTPAIILTVSLFFLWGMANNLNDILIAHFRRAFTLSDFETSFVQQAFYMGYFLLATPAAMLARRRGYKAAIVTGLTLYAIGALLFYPATHFGEYRWFLAALFVIACGLAFLETSASPLIAELGSPEGAARRLNFAQAANPLGTIFGVLVGKYFILSSFAQDDKALAAMSAAERTATLRGELASVQTPYLVIGLVVLAFAIAAALIAFPDNRKQGDAPAVPTGKALGTVLRDRTLVFAVVAQFFYVGAQVGLWSYTIRYAQVNLPGLTEQGAADYLFASLVLFGVGRFVGAALLGKVKAPQLLVVFAGLSAALAAVAVFVGGTTGLYALVAASFFMSIQFPTIFAIGIGGLGALKQIGASLIVMAIIGGAVLTAAMGHLSDLAGINMALLVPAVAFLVVLGFGVRATGTAGDVELAPAGH
ncbi:L-fucose:H+ symporter permease [uncultured Sphingomonas sp.]|uniref:L-fucose:H+ symporter permease n=1 Tax=uncultured Sphingomonas sp. TaxID=158754 RepID=UPI0025EC0595|nr:L-fucose:H+ symporter permease [uncultured Sphingomonas sp.]